MAASRINQDRRRTPNKGSAESVRRVASASGGERKNGRTRFVEEDFETGRRRSAVKRVGREVKSKVSGMDLDKVLVLLHAALALAIVVKQTRDHRRPRKAAPFRSAMSVLNYYLNEGRELSEMQRATLEDIKEELRMLYNRENEEMITPAG
jgi:hypothetical protein